MFTFFIISKMISFLLDIFFFLISFNELKYYICINYQIIWYLLINLFYLKSYLVNLNGLYIKSYKSSTSLGFLFKLLPIYSKFV
jgi:hypothetical protein